MFAVAGLGNTVFHPADYALLSQHVPHERAGRVFSFHTFAGMVGNAAAPATLLYFQSMWGWRGAFLAAAVLGRRGGGAPGAGRASRRSSRSARQAARRPKAAAPPSTAGSS